MCPACLASAALIATKTAALGGLTVVVLKKVRSMAKSRISSERASKSGGAPS